MDILKGLHKTELDALRASFLEDPDGLNLTEFVENVGKYFRDSSPDTAHNSSAEGSLVALFRTIDFDGDQRITWDEFTTYSIDSHIRHTQQKPHEWVSSYLGTKTAESSDPILKLTFLRYWGPEGKFVAFCKKRPFKIYSPKTMQLLKVAPADAVGRGTLTACEFIPAHNFFAAASSDSNIRFFDREFQLRHTLPLEATAMKLTWCKRSYVLYAGLKNGRFLVIDIGRTAGPSANTKKTRVTLTLEVHTKAISDFIVHPQHASKVFSCSLDGTIKVFDVEKSDRSDIVMRQIGGHSNGVLGIAYCALHDYICSIGYELDAFCWATNSANSAHLKTHKKICLEDHSNPHKGNFTGIHCVENTSEVITMDVSGYIKVWDLRSFKCTQTLLMGWSPAEAYPPPVKHACMCYSDISKVLITAERRRICLHAQDIEEKSASESVSIVLYNSTQRSFMTASGRDIKIWEAQQGCLTSLYSSVASADITALCIDEYGRRVYIGTQDGGLSCRIYHTCSLINSYVEDCRHASEIFAMCYLSERRQLFTSALDGSVFIHTDKDRGRRCTVLHPARKNSSLAEPIYMSVSFSLTLFASATPQQVCIRDVTNPRKPMAEFSPPDGNTIIGITFLQQKGGLVLSYSSGRFAVISTRPMMTKLESGMSDLAPTVLAQWANTAHLYKRIDDLRTAAASHVIREHLQQDPNSAPTHISHAPLEFNEAQYQERSYNFYSANERFPPASCLHYEAGSHILWTGDVKGRVTAWSLCDVFSQHGLHDLSYPVKLEVDGTLPHTVFLKNTKQHPITPTVQILRSWLAHSDEIRHLCVNEDTGTVVTSGDDRRALIWDCEGVLVAELSYAKNYPHYGVCKIPEMADKGAVGSPRQLGAVFNLGDVIYRMTRLSSFFFTSATSAPVTLVKLLTRLQGATDQGVTTSPVCGHPREVVVLPSIKDVLRMTPDDCKDMVRRSPFAAPSARDPSDAVPLEALLPDLPVQELCTRYAAALLPYAVLDAPPEVHITEGITIQEPLETSLRVKCEELGSQRPRRSRAASILAGPPAQKKQAQFSRMKSTIIGRTLPATAAIEESVWWCTNKERERSLFQCSDGAAPKARTQTRHNKEHTAQPAVARLPDGVCIKKIAARAVACVAALTLSAAVSYCETLEPLEALQSIAQDARRGSLSASTVDTRPKPQEVTLERKEVEVFSNEACLGHVRECERVGLHNVRADMKVWSEMDLGRRLCAERVAREGATPPACCAANGGVAVRRSFQRAGQQRRGMSAPQQRGSCRNVMDRPVPGAARCSPAPPQKGREETERPQTGRTLIGRRVHAQHLHALSNGFIPATATNEASCHSAMFRPQGRQRAPQEVIE